MRQRNSAKQSLDLMGARRCNGSKEGRHKKLRARCNKAANSVLASFREVIMPPAHQINPQRVGVGKGSWNRS